MSTDKQIQANRENSKLSTGPVTASGKAISSHNAVKTGLTGQTVLLKTDDVNRYDKHVERFSNKFKPANEDECALVQDLADTEWRLLRITPLENGILALGRVEMAPLFASESDAALRDQFIEAKVFMTYRRDLANLSLQQSRLRKHRNSVTEELTKLQSARKDKNRLESNRVGEYYLEAVKNNLPLKIGDFGFEITLDDVLYGLAFRKALCQHDKFPELTRKVYLEEYRVEYNSKFAEQ